MPFLTIEDANCDLVIPLTAIDRSLFCEVGKTSSGLGHLTVCPCPFKNRLSESDVDLTFSCQCEERR